MEKRNEALSIQPTTRADSNGKYSISHLETLGDDGKVRTKHLRAFDTNLHWRSPASLTMKC